MATSRALLIGIDAYQHVRALDGCVNDVTLMRSVLVERFAFPEANVVLLANAEATRAAILGAFDALVAATGPDDVVVIHFAGHGSQMRDREGDEPSGFDSTLMPWDTARAPGENRDITDDEVHLVLQALAARTPHTTIIVDACHSGTVTRDAFGAKTRSVPPDLRPVSQLPPSPVPGGRLDRAASAASGWLPLDDTYVFISGCRDNEESKEYVPNEGGGPHGALTYFLCQELRKATPRTTIRDVFDVVSSRVTAYNSIQHPQLEGPSHKVVFGVRELPPEPYVPVEARTDAVLTLAAGSAQGVTVGSTYAVHAPGAKSRQDAPALGEAVVTDVAAFSSRARVTHESSPGAITAAARAFETAHAFTTTRLGVELADADATASFAARLAASTLVSVAADGAPAWTRIYRLPARTSVAAGDPVPQAGPLGAPAWAVVDRTGHLVMPLKPSGQEAVVVENLETLARHARAIALDNPDPACRLRGTVTIDLLRKGADGSLTVAEPEANGGQVIFDEGQAVTFRITNSGPRAVFVAIAYLGATGSVDVIKQVELAPSVHYDVPGKVHFPERYPFVEFGDALRGVDVVDTLKLFVTGEFIDFSSLEQAGVRAVTSPLASWLQRAGGGHTRAFTPDAADDAPVVNGAFAWTTVSRSFVIRRRATPLTASDAPAAIGQAVVTAPAIVGTLGTGVDAAGQDTTSAFATDALRQAFDAAGVAMKQTLVIDEARQTSGSGTRGVAAPVVDVQLAAPPEGYGQMVLACDELGVMAWAFAEPDTASRGAGTRSASRTFRVRAAVPDQPTGQPGTRGLIGLAGRKVFKELLFPLAAPLLGQVGTAAVHHLESSVWPYRVRSFTPDDYTNPDAPALGPDDWARMGRGRALLMVHGTFSRTHLAFAAMPKDYVESLHRQYEGRVFAFDHLFLSDDPADNVRWLLSQVPEGVTLDVDIICHSRGGLVSRTLAEKQAELSPARQPFRVGTVVLVGVPNAGTALADPEHVTDIFDVFTNLINFVPDTFVVATGAMTMIVEAAKIAATGGLTHLAGLRSMRPGGDFTTWLNAAGPSGATRYVAVSSDVTPTEPGLVHLATSRLLTAMLKAHSDFVVPTGGVYEANGSPHFPVAQPLLLAGADGVLHTKYFTLPRVREQVLAWLATT